MNITYSDLTTVCSYSHSKPWVLPFLTDMDEKIEPPKAAVTKDLKWEDSPVVLLSAKLTGYLLLWGYPNSILTHWIAHMSCGARNSSLVLLHVSLLRQKLTAAIAGLWYDNHVSRQLHAYPYLISKKMLL